MSPTHAPTFADRVEAGRALAEEFRSFAGRDDVVVVGLPRGGVPVAAEVAAALGAPLDVVVVRKLGLPGNEEFAMGAIASGGVVDWNDEVVDRLSVPEEAVHRVLTRELDELRRREDLYRRGRRPNDLAGKVVVVVDDGLATGATLRAALASIRRSLPARVLVGVPVAAPDACDRLRGASDACVAVFEPDDFRAVGQFYDDFRPTSDAEVVACLDRAAARIARGATNGACPDMSGCGRR